MESISKYVKFLKDLENGLIEYEDQDSIEKKNIALIESLDLFEDRNISFNDMTRELNIDKEEVTEIFNIIASNTSTKSKLKKINTIVDGGGVERYNRDGLDILYIVTSDTYDYTILSSNGKFYFGSLGRMMEEGNINALVRIS